jgi:hypothetical protein
LRFFNAPVEEPELKDLHTFEGDVRVVQRFVPVFLEPPPVELVFSFAFLAHEVADQRLISAYYILEDFI